VVLTLPWASVKKRMKSSLVPSHQSATVDTGEPRMAEKPIPVAFHAVLNIRSTKYERGARATRSGFASFI